MTQEDYSRRDFIAKTVAAGAALGLAGCSGSSDEGEVYVETDNLEEASFHENGSVEINDITEQEDPSTSTMADGSDRPNVYGDGNFRITEHDLIEDSHGAEYTGEIENISDTSYDDVNIFAKFYAHDGSLLGKGMGASMGLDSGEAKDYIVRLEATMVEGEFFGRTEDAEVHKILYE